MDKVKTFEAQFLAPENFRPTGNFGGNRNLWARNVKQLQPIYQHGRVVLFQKAVTIKPQHEIQTFFQSEADKKGWNLTSINQV